MPKPKRPFALAPMAGTLATLFLAFSFACGDRGAREDSQTPSSLIPPDLTWEVISEDTYEKERRSLDVRLSQAVDEKVLEELANTLKESESQPFARTFIVYYLPDMPVGGGGWATSHFDPELVVKILGMEPGSGSRMAALRSEYGENLIGAWENNQPGSAASFVLFKTDQGTALLKTYPDGSGSPISVREVRSSQGRRFEDPENRFGEFYLMRNGNLELHDDEGVVFVAHPMSG